jgi:hypothetical protein
VAVASRFSCFASFRAGSMAGHGGLLGFFYPFDR